MTVHPGQYYRSSFKAADFVHLMSYDGCPKGPPCQHATLADAKSQVASMLRQGLPPEKLLLGIPAYGRECPTTTTNHHHNHPHQHATTPTTHLAPQRRG